MQLSTALKLYAAGLVPNAIYHSVRLRIALKRSGFAGEAHEEMMDSIATSTFTILWPIATPTIMILDTMGSIAKRLVKRPIQPQKN